MSAFKIYTINRDVIYPAGAQSAPDEETLIDRLISAGHGDLYVSASDGLAVLRVTGKYLPGATSRLEERYALYRADDGQPAATLLQQLARSIQQTFASDDWLAPSQSAAGGRPDSQDGGDPSAAISISPEAPREDCISPSSARSLIAPEQTAGDEHSRWPFATGGQDNRSAPRDQSTGESESEWTAAHIRATVKSMADQGGSRNPLLFGAYSYQQALTIGRECAQEGEPIVVGGLEPENYFEDASLIVKYRHQTACKPLNRWTKRQASTAKQNYLDTSIETAMSPIEDAIDDITTIEASAAYRVKALATVGKQTLGEWQDGSRFDGFTALPADDQPPELADLVSLVQEVRIRLPDRGQARFEHQLATTFEEAFDDLEEELLDAASDEIDGVLAEYVPALSVATDNAPSIARTRLLRETWTRTGGPDGWVRLRLHRLSDVGDQARAVLTGRSQERPAIPRAGLFGLLLALVGVVGLVVRFTSIADPYYGRLQNLVIAHKIVVIVGGLLFVLLFVGAATRRKSPHTARGQPSRGILAGVRVPSKRRLLLWGLIATVLLLVGVATLQLVPSSLCSLPLDGSLGYC